MACDRRFLFGFWPKTSFGKVTVPVLLPDMSKAWTVRAPIFGVVSFFGADVVVFISFLTVSFLATGIFTPFYLLFCLVVFRLFYLPFRLLFLLYFLSSLRPLHLLLVFPQVVLRIF